MSDHFETSCEEAIRERAKVWFDDPTNGVVGRVEWEGFEPQPSWRGTKRARINIRWTGARPLTTGGTSTRGTGTLPVQVFEYRGTLNIQLWVPGGDGIGQALEGAAALCDLFRNWRSTWPQVEMDAMVVTNKRRDGKDAMIELRCTFTAYGEFEGVDS